MTHDEMVAKWFEDPAFKTEYERIEREEMPMLDAILAARNTEDITRSENNPDSSSSKRNASD